MANYTQFWEEKIKIISKKISLDKESNFTIDIPEISEVGNRDESGYNGYLNTCIGKIEKFTESEVFRDLRDVISKSKNYSNKFPGQVAFRIQNDSVLGINYSPITYSILISRYKKIIDREQSLGNETYKWRLIRSFQEEWERYATGNIPFQDFFQSVTFENLLYELSIAVLKHLNKAAPVKFEELIQELFDESQLLKSRISNYQGHLKNLYFTLEDHGQNTFQEERTIATLLTFRYPEKYTFFKDTFYTAYCKGTGQKPRQPGQKIYHYYEIIHDFSKHLSSNYPELISWKNQHLDENCYRDENNLILAQNIFYRVLDNKKDKETEVSSNPELQDPIEPIEMKTPLNQILFGPPGTGKTYHSINHAISIIEGKTLNDLELEERSEVKSRFDRYIEAGQVVFTTFHQSMCYEDFVEGIKPVLKNADEESDVPEELNGELQYHIEKGIFVKFCKRASVYSSPAKPTKPSVNTFKPIDFEKTRFFKMSLGNSNLTADDAIFRYCMDNDYIAIGYGGPFDFANCKSRDDIRNLLVENKYIEPGKMNFNIYAIERFKLCMRVGDIVLISNGNYEVRAIGVISGEYEFDRERGIPYSHFRKVKWMMKDVTLPVADIYEKQFSQQTIYQLYENNVKQDFFRKGTVTTEERKFVIIIDEINRGNVSQVLGELITLIEEDKRLGRPEQLKAILPYSKEEFGVPQNLYIIGTMNTADRSVEALDTALRRRFSFVEMKPQYDLKPLEREIIEDVTLSRLLKVINARIEKLMDKDHMIGHSYFLNVSGIDDLKCVFRNKIIPLLQEYFYGDFGKIGLVLGDGFVQREKDGGTGKFFADFEDYEEIIDLEERKVYRLVDLRTMNPEDFTNAVYRIFQ